jgi:hypothetical protein
MKTTPHKSNAEAVPSKPVDAPSDIASASVLDTLARLGANPETGLTMMQTPASVPQEMPQLLYGSVYSQYVARPRPALSPSTWRKSREFEEKENDLFTRTCSESSLDSMRRRTSCQAAKLPSCQAAKISLSESWFPLKAIKIRRLQRSSLPIGVFPHRSCAKALFHHRRVRVHWRLKGYDL